MGHNYSHDGYSLGNGFAKHDTGKSLLVVLDDGEEMFIPHSQLHEDSEVYEKGHEGEVISSLWLAHQRGWSS